ncbi:outer membrane protein assembly factor BamB [Spartinivicinus ruber]|uniref:outer membrane protein assembly factor BamB n=1 Tax=Spartinivicinus ruber TaxID=2683272 RepID=UPI0013D081D9|nr:outer membrane protein assembly factor BamB [Spartinivicinus ruber]
MKPNSCTFLKLVSTAALITLLSGCSLFDSDDSDSALEPKPLTDIENTIKVREVWNHQVGEGYDDKYYKLTPAIDGNRIFASDVHGEVVALDRDSGDELWEVELELPVSGGVTAGHGKVLVGTETGEVIALSQDNGKVLWKAQLTSEVLAAPQTDGQVVIARSIDDKLVGLDAETGKRIWIYEGNPPVLTLRGTSSPLLIKGLAVSGFSDGKMKAFAADKGIQVWEQRVAVPQGRNELERIVDIDATPLFHEGVIYAVSYQGQLVALDPRSGEVLWQRKASSVEGLSQGFGNLYLSDNQSYVTAIDASSSSTLWQQQDLENRKITAPTPISNYVVVGDFEGYVHYISQLEGQFAGRVKVDSSGIRTQPITDGVFVYIYSNDGDLTALEIVK